MKRIAYGTVVLFGILLMGGCDLLGGIFKSSDRPPIPEPTSYIGEVPLESEHLIVATLPLSDFTPIVAIVKDANGNQVATPAERMTLVEDTVLLPSPDYTGGEGGQLSSTPQIQLIRYWVRLGSVQRYPGGTTTEVERSVTKGTESSEAISFGGSIGASVEVSGDALFASVSVKVSTEFSYNNTETSTISQSETTTQTFTVELEPDMNLVYCVWQLVEEYRIVDPDQEVDDVTGEESWVTYSDERYVFADGTLDPMIVFTSEIVPETTLFKN